jgi:hypothetical protein
LGGKLTTNTFNNSARKIFRISISAALAATKKWMPLALFPQAGVAIGMALVASTHFPEYRQILLPVIISTTVVFEIIGPIFTRLALKRASKT